MNNAFEKFKVEIVRAVYDGVCKSKKGQLTALVSDWFKVGIGFFFCQKHCNCPRESVGCCQSGWRVTYVGYRLCNDAESRYAPVEGDMLGVAWALSNTRTWMLGCERLKVVMDHKPLVGLLSNRSLADIMNHCLLLWV